MRAVRAGIAAFLIASSAPARADSGPGTTGAEFLRIGVGARPAGLAETYAALADGALAMAYNPAGLAFQRRTEVSLAHNELASGLRHEWAGLAVPTPWATFGVSANALFVRPFESYDAFDRPSGKTSAFDSAYSFALAAPVSDTFAIGGIAGALSSRLHDRTARGFTAGGGAVWRASRAFSLGVSVLDLGPALDHGSQAAELPYAIRAGAAWTPFNSRDFAHYFTLSVDAVKVHEERVAVRGGVELWYDRILALRAGGRSDAPSGPSYSLGIGVRLYNDDEAPLELDFDYAYADLGDFSESHRAGLTLRFGPAVTDGARSAVFAKERLYRERAPRPKSRAPAPKPSPKPRRVDEPYVPYDLETWMKP